MLIKAKVLLKAKPTPTKWRQKLMNGTRTTGLNPETLRLNDPILFRQTCLTCRQISWSVSWQCSKNNLLSRWAGLLSDAEIHRLPSTLCLQPHRDRVWRQSHLWAWSWRQSAVGYAPTTFCTNWLMKRSWCCPAGGSAVPHFVPFLPTKQVEEERPPPGQQVALQQPPMRINIRLSHNCLGESLDWTDCFYFS